MNFTYNISAHRIAGLAALLVAIVTASGCGKALPTSPLVDPGATSVQSQTSASGSAMKDSGSGGEPGPNDGGGLNPIGPGPELLPSGTTLGGLGQGQGHGNKKGHRQHKH